MSDHIKTIKSMLHSPIGNYILPGLTSSLVGGVGKGTVRLFEASRPNQELITPHSHRYNFACYVLQGKVFNTMYQPSKAVHAVEYMVSALRKTEAGLERQADSEVEKFQLETTAYLAGEWYSMASSEIHSIRFSQGAVVLFFEGPEVTDSSLILEPYVHGEHLKTFKIEDWMYKRG